MKTKFFLLTFSILFLALGSKVSAQSPSPTGTSIRDSIKQQVTEELKEIKQAVSKRAWLGTITSKTETGFVMTTHLGQTKNVTITTDTTIRLTGSKDGTLTDLKVNDYILVMGNVDGAGNMTAIRLLVVTKPNEDKRKTIMGTVTAVTTSSLTLETISKESWTVKLSSAVKYNDKVKSTDIKVGAKIIVLGTTTGATGMTAKFVHLFPASQ